jgi:hypothetical protein
MSMMDLFFSPREKWLANCLMLLWFSIRTHTIVSEYVRRYIRKAEARRHRRRRSLRAVPPENWALAPTISTSNS